MYQQGGFRLENYSGRGISVVSISTVGTVTFPSSLLSTR
jgi:hypothetical protein